MNTSAECLRPDQVRSMLDGELSPAEAAAVEEHLSDCDDCRRRLDHAAGDPEWWNEARESLRSMPAPHLGASDSAAPPSAADACHADVLRLLGPTDDPRMLGRIGTYEIAGILGRGGMGVVFKGFDAALNRYVAIKMLLPHLAATGAARRRFAREAQAAAAVVDDHVMPIHNVSEWQGMPYLVMPYSRGVSLQRRLTDQGPLDVREVLRIGMQTARALAAAHAQGLVHRDVKPGNIMLAEGVERVTLTDFGLARAADDSALTRTGTLAGTPQYMSPEQVRGQPDDARSDLFSLGSVLYAACTGRPPFRADSSYGVLRMITDDSPRPIREINPDVPAWLCGIVERLMAKRPGDRYASAQEVADLLEACLAHVQQPTRAALPAAAAVAAKPAPGRGQRHRSKFRITGRILVMVAIIAAIVLSLVGVQKTSPPDIAGQWTGDEWGTVELKQTRPGEYTGTYTDTFGRRPGEIRLTWSRIEQRYHGTWREGEDRFGEVSVRVTGDNEIRGAMTTDKGSKINPGTPRLADLAWARPIKTASGDAGGAAALAPVAPVAPLAKPPTTLLDQSSSFYDPRNADTDTIFGKQRANLLTVAQLLDQGQALYHSRQKVTVRFRVASAKQIKVLHEDGKESTQWQLSSGVAEDRVDPRSFSILLSAEAEAALKKGGVDDVSKHYVGKAIEVEGVVYGVGLDLISRPDTIWTYHIDVKSLDQIRDAGPDAGAGGPAAKRPEGAAVTPGRLNYFTTGHSIKMACSADGKLIAVANGNPTSIMLEGGTIRVKGGWKPTADILDIETGKVVVRLKLTTGDEDAVLAATERFSRIEATALAFSPAGDVVAVGTSIGQVKLYDVRTGELLRSLDDEPVKLADKKTPGHWKSLRRAMGGVGSLAFSPDGTLLATSGGSFADASDGFDGVTRFTRKATGPGRLKVWEVKTGTLKQDLVGYSYASTVAFSPDGTTLASAGSWLNRDGRQDGNGVILWNPQTGAKIRTITNEANGGTHAIAFSPDGKMIVMGLEPYDKVNAAYTTAVGLADVSTGITKWHQKVPEGAKPKGFSPDGGSVLVLCGQSIQFLDAATGAVKREIKSNDLSKNGRWDDVAISPQGKWLVIGAVDEEEGNVELRHLDGPGAAPRGAAATPRAVDPFRPTGPGVDAPPVSAKDAER